MVSMDQTAVKAVVSVTARADLMMDTVQGDVLTASRDHSARRAKPQTGDTESSNVGAIVGGVVAAVLVLAVIAIVVIVCRRCVYYSTFTTLV